MFHVCYCILTNFLSLVMLLKRTNAPYSHDGCVIVMTPLLSIRGASQPFHAYHCSFKKHFRLGMHIMGALVKCSSLDEIGTIVFHVTVLCTATCKSMPQRALKSSKQSLMKMKTQKRCVGQRYCRFCTGSLCHLYSIPI